MSHFFSCRQRRPLLPAAMVIIAGFASSAIAETTTVRLVVDYGDGVQVQFSSLAWREGMTVLDALAAARDHRHGVNFTQRGSGSSAMVLKIGDQANEGGGGKSKNWIFSVNDKPADVGAGAYKLKPDDVVLWKFQVYEYNSK